MYFANAALLFFLFMVIAGVWVTVDPPAVENLMGFYPAEAWRALLAACFGPLYRVADMTLWIGRTGARLSQPLT